MRVIWASSRPSVFRHEFLLDRSVIIQERVFCVAAVLIHHDAFPCQLRTPLEIDQRASEPMILVKCGRKRRSVDASVETEERTREMREEIEVLQKAVEEQGLHAQRDALLAEAGRGAGGGERRSNCEERRIVDDYANTCARSPNRHVAFFFFSPLFNSVKTPKI